MSITDAFSAPSPKTVCVPFSHKSQALQPAAAWRSFRDVGRGGTSGAALLTPLSLAGMHALMTCTINSLPQEPHSVLQHLIHRMRKNLGKIQSTLYWRIRVLAVRSAGSQFQVRLRKYNDYAGVLH
jgi:hypothetical protein